MLRGTMVIGSALGNRMPGQSFVFLGTKLDPGGAQLLQLQLAREMRARGHRAVSWFLYLQQPAYKGDPDAQVLLDRPARGPLAYAIIFWRLVVLLRRLRPDAVCCSLPLANLLGSLAAWLAGVPVRAVSHHYPIETISRPKRMADGLWARLGLYTRVVAVSRAVAESFGRQGARYRRILTVIPNGVALPPRRLDRLAARRCLELPADGFVVGTIGRLADQKNQRVLLAAMASVPDLHLAIAGSGPLEAELRAQAQPMGQRMHWLGARPPEEITDILGAFDLFAMPSLYEGMPLAVVEALHAGLPVVASDIPTISEVVRPDDGPDGAVLLPHDDPRVWAEAIVALAADPDRRAALVRAADRIAALFTLERMAAGYERLLTTGRP